MADELTARLGLPLLVAGQAQKEVFHNEALSLLDIMVHAHVESATVTTPPASPAAGQAWIVPAAATGAWVGHSGAVAAWTAGGWRFVAPVVGMRVDVADEGASRRYDGTAWQAEGVRADGYYIGGVRVVGARQAAISDVAGGAVVDSNARSAVNAILAVLRAHGLIA